MVANKILEMEKNIRKSKVALDVETEQMIRYARDQGIETVFERQSKYDESFLGVDKDRCHFGSLGICCRQCAMGPCRLMHDDLPNTYKIDSPKLDKGTCGASADTIVARNLLMMVARGTAAHAAHAGHVATTLSGIAQNKVPHTLSEPDKLRSISSKLGLDKEGQSIEEIAYKTSLAALFDISGSKENMKFAASYCPLNDTLTNLGVAPRSVGYELLETGHETSMGTMADPTTMILHAIRLGVADIASLVIASEFQDVIFGIPKPVSSRIGFNVLEEDKVNVVMHGHVPLLSEKIVALSEDAQLIDKAKSMGAEGINIVGCCCTGNEILMRYGVPLAGSNLQQELVIATGLVEGFVVDVQCIYPNIQNVASQFHTKIISTMDEARFTDAIHIPFDDEYADEAARKILNTAIENFPNRSDRIFLPEGKPKDLMAGFSVETCLSVLSQLNPDDPLKPLIDNIAAGNIYGAVLLAGCTSPKITADASHVTIARELLRNNVLIIATGCAAQACARAGLLSPEATEKYAGDKLKQVLDVLGKTAGLDSPLPPVWHFGSCVDNSRVIILISALAQKLGVQIKDLPIAASAAEWVTEKAAAIGSGAVGLGVTVHLGVAPPVLGSPAVVSLLTRTAKELSGGKFIVDVDPKSAARTMLDHITQARTNLGL